MRLLAALVFLMGISGVAQANCVFTRNLGSHTIVDDNTIVFHGVGRREVTVTTNPHCKATRAEKLGFRLRSTNLCTGDLIDLLDYDMRWMGSCRVASITTNLR